jgi:hypothetical protein
MLVITEEAKGCKPVFHTGKTVTAGRDTIMTLAD